MKASLIVAPILAVLLGGVAFELRQGTSLHSHARRKWKERSIAEISNRIENPAWTGNELARLKKASALQTDGESDWVSDEMILMKSGEWLTYRSVCQKKNRRICDLFLARGSDAKWYYSTYHFCVNMIVLRMDDQSPDLASFTKTYSLRTFDGWSDDCLEKTWPPDSR